MVKFKRRRSHTGGDLRKLIIFGSGEKSGFCNKDVVKCAVSELYGFFRVFFNFLEILTKTVHHSLIRKPDFFIHFFTFFLLLLLVSISKF